MLGVFTMGKNCRVQRLLIRSAAHARAAPHLNIIRFGSICSVAVQIAFNFVQFEEKTRNVHGYLSIFDEEMDEIKGELNSYV